MKESLFLLRNIFFHVGIVVNLIVDIVRGKEKVKKEDKPYMALGISLILFCLLLSGFFFFCGFFVITNQVIFGDKLIQIV